MVIPREPRIFRGHRRDYTLAPQIITKVYLLGVLHDATERRTTYRIASKSRDFSELLKKGICQFGVRAWIYKEGNKRDLWIVEFSKNLLKGIRIKTRRDKINYIRGYFDSEGGIAKSSSVRYYLYFAQKNKTDLIQVRHFLEELNISCGLIHNPSKKTDPDYWRFFIRAKSYTNFAKMIGSDHPEKRQYLRMKI